MVRLYDADSEAEIGQITEAQLEVLVEQLVEETLDEYSYNITPQAINSLVNAGADPALVSILKRALGGRTSIEVRYELD
jgi:hypothetical protein